uniref:Uncharacterized protein n=1 Tax=Parastrongyloides trichosuri TaxID=131310 RepID=A0A0N4ZZR8_PARTI
MDIFSNNTNKDSEQLNQAEDRRKSLSQEVGDVPSTEKTETRGGLTRILFGPETGFLGTFAPGTHEHKMVTLDEFMKNYERCLINGDGFEKQDYEKHKNFLLGGNMMYDMLHGKKNE